MKTTQAIKILTVFLFFNYSFGQVYKFDKIVKTKFSTKTFPNQEMTFLFNSQDFTYSMQIYGRNDSLISRIFDIKAKQVHYFYVDRSDSSKLKFLETLTKKNNGQDYTFEFSKMKNEKDENEMFFNILNQKKKRIAKYKFIIGETEQNFFPIFKLSGLDGYIYNDMTPPMNFIVLKAKGKNSNGKKIEYELTSIFDVDLSVELPK